MLTITRLELCLPNEDSELRILLVTLYFILKNYCRVQKMLSTILVIKRHKIKIDFFLAFKSLLNEVILQQCKCTTKISLMS